jgi:hypothetical protein
MMLDNWLSERGNAAAVLYTRASGTIIALADDKKTLAADIYNNGLHVLVRKE